jgi:hypothetical protein
MISRADGRSATAAAAYRAGVSIEDARTGVIHDYTRKGGVAHTEIIASENAPGWVDDRETLWNEVEGSEKRINSQVAREVLLSLPHELTHEQRVALTKDFVRANFVARGMVADIAIHEPPKGGDQRNHHAHVMLTTREISQEGFTTKNRSWNSKEMLQEWRESWAQTQNRHLVQALGKDAPQLTHKSYAEQGLARTPGVHLGPEATALERRGTKSFRGEQARKAVNDNAKIQERAEKVQEAIEARLAPETRKNLGALAVEMKALITDLEAQKVEVEKRLAGIQGQMKDARRKSATAVRQSTLAPFEKAEFEARQELERREKEARQGRDLDAKTIVRWVTNPAEMLWKSAQEQMARDSAANAAGAKLKEAQANKKQAVEWLKTTEGRGFIQQKIAEIRSQSPEMFAAAERVHQAEQARKDARAKVKSPQGKQMVEQKVKQLQGDIGGLRTEERKARRNLAQLNRNIGRAGRTAHLARNLYENDLAGSIKAPGDMLDTSRYLRAVQGELAGTVRALKPEQQQALTLNLRRVLSLGLGG